MSQILDFPLVQWGFNTVINSASNYVLVRQSYYAKIDSKRAHSFLRNATNRNTVGDPWDPLRCGCAHYNDILGEVFVLGVCTLRVLGYPDCIQNVRVDHFTRW